MWCSSAVKRSPFFCSAACRTRPSAACARVRLCVRSVKACGEFRLASRLPSSLSAARLLALFETFLGTTQLSDFPGSCISGVRLSTSRCAPAPALLRVRLEESWDLPVLVRGVSVHARGLRPRGVPVQLALLLDRVLPSAQGDSVGTPIWLISGLNTRPARTPTNASRPALRLTPHSSGPAWIASPSPYDSCIRYTSPLIPAQPPSRPHPPLAAIRGRNGVHADTLSAETYGFVASRPLGI